ncbi:hypothetical protein EW146_g8088 [Bondarzewia mesenterica]|uniref:Cytochrome P450 n=1 Tax=Bondarzewia mesenterica TaxID=1095465 RepID=A0A4V3XDW5_9AGAM|nr:hypothetical protein EW146_g8088 [Bondarzewia mesenterica]
MRVFSTYADLVISHPPEPPLQDGLRPPEQSQRPFSLRDYLKEELLATDFDSHQELKWESVSYLLAIPLATGKIIGFGFVLCLECFLYTFTIHPIRFVLAFGGKISDPIGGSAFGYLSARTHTYVDQSPLVARRLEFAALPLAVLAILIGWQARLPASIVSLCTCIASVQWWTWAGKSGWKAWFRRGMYADWEAGCFETGQMGHSGIDVLGMLMQRNSFVVVKIIMGVNLISYAMKRKAGMEAREVADKVNDFGQDPIGEEQDKQRYNRELKTLLDNTREDAAPTTEIGEHSELSFQMTRDVGLIKLQSPLHGMWRPHASEKALPGAWRRHYQHPANGRRPSRLEAPLHRFVFSAEQVSRVVQSWQRRTYHQWCGFAFSKAAPPLILDRDQLDYTPCDLTVRIPFCRFSQQSKSHEHVFQSSSALLSNNEPTYIPEIESSALAGPSRTVKRRRPLKDLQGPTASSFWLGNEIDIHRQNEVGDLDFQWIRQWGTAWRINGCMGSDILMLADPKALQYVLHTSGYRFPKCAELIQTLRLFGGESLATLVQKWKDEDLSSGEATINVASWLSRVTLDVIGEAGFDIDLGALDNYGKTELSQHYNNLFLDSTLYPSSFDILFKFLWRFIPMSILKYVRYWPSREYTRFRKYLDFARIFSQRIIKKSEAQGDGKDIMSVLLRANSSENPMARLSDSEMIDQMSGLLLAGHDTSGTTLIWTFWELAKDPVYQSKIREEIKAARAKAIARGDVEFSVTDLDGMVHLQAALKESMRLHPIVWKMTRVAGDDDVIPLAFPITTKSGKQLSNIPVKKGTHVLLSICGYSRLPQVWGADANLWNPDRFLKMDKGKQTSLGVYANLLNFSGGLRACIGWRFSVVEMQAILVALLENFEFSLPKDSDKKKIQKKPTAIMVPLVEGYHGSWMGLNVKTVT